MEAIKTWARSIFILSVLSSTVLLMVPKSMQKQAKFVAEMLILLCVVAPLSGLLSSGAEEALSLQGEYPDAGGDTSLGRFYADETARRVLEIGEAAGVPVATVDVTTKDSGFTLESVVVCLEGEPPDETLSAFKGSLTAYLGIGEDKLRVVMGE